VRGLGADEGAATRRRCLATLILAATLFVVAVAYVPGVMSPSVAGRWAAITAVGLTIVLTRLPSASLEAPAARVAALTLGWLAVSTTWSASPLDTIGVTLHWAALAGLMMLAHESEDLLPAWRALAVGVTVSLPFELAQLIGYEPVLSVSRVAVTGNVGLFMLSNVAAEVSAATAVLMLCHRQWLLAVGPLLCAALTGRNEVLLMLGAAGLSTMWSSRGSTTRAAAILAVVVMTAAAAVNVYASRVPVEFLAQRGALTMSFRVVVWLATVGQLSVLGGGAGTYALFFPEAIFAHNELLHYAFELGVGVIPLTWMVAHAMRSSPSPERHALAALVGSALVWAPLQDPSTAAVFAVLAGYLCGARRRARAAESAGRALDVDRAERPLAVAATALRQADRDDERMAVRSQHPHRG